MPHVVRRIFSHFITLWWQNKTADGVFTEWLIYVSMYEKLLFLIWCGNIISLMCYLFCLEIDLQCHIYWPFEPKAIWSLDLNYKMPFVRCHPCRLFMHASETSSTYHVVKYVFGWSVYLDQHLCYLLASFLIQLADPGFNLLGRHPDQNPFLNNLITVTSENLKGNYKTLY